MDGFHSVLVNEMVNGGKIPVEFLELSFHCDESIVDLVSSQIFDCVEHCITVVVDWLDKKSVNRFADVFLKLFKHPALFFKLFTFLHQDCLFALEKWNVLLADYGRPGFPGGSCVSNLEEQVKHQIVDSALFHTDLSM